MQETGKYIFIILKDHMPTENLLLKGKTDTEEPLEVFLLQMRIDDAP